MRTAKFDLPRDFKLTFDIEAVNDDTYLLDYRYSAKDRLDSEISVERARRDEYIRAAITHFKTLRIGRTATQPCPPLSAMPNMNGGSFPARLGGELRFSAASPFSITASSSDLTTDGADFDAFADGRDVTRLTASADWYRSWILPGGIHTRFQTGVAVDSFPRQARAGGPARSRGHRSHPLHFAAASHAAAKPPPPPPM